MIMPPATIKAAEAFNEKKPPLVTLLLHVNLGYFTLLPPYTMQTDKNPLSPPCTTKIVFCSRSRNYHLFTRVRHTRLFTSGTVCDWLGKVPPSKRGLPLVVSRGLGKEPFNREGALQWLSTTAKVFACLSSSIFPKNARFFE